MAAGSLNSSVSGRVANCWEGIAVLEPQALA